MTAGRAAYAEAMALYQQGRISAAELDAYRIASPHTTLPKTPRDPETALRRLVEEADNYLATLTGPGVAEIRAGLNHWRHGHATTAGAVVPTLNYLPAALAQLHATHPTLAHAIAQAAPHLTWVTYAYDTDIGTSFPANHCFASLIGADAAIPAADFDFGLFLIAPHVLYRDHHHAAPELYTPLTGPHGWRFAPDRPLIVKPAHKPVWNDPHQPHLTKVGPTPFLAFYGWTRDTASRARVIPAQDWPELEALRLG